MTRGPFPTYRAFLQRHAKQERDYWRRLARHPRATSYRHAARMAGVCASTVLRKFQQYRLRLKYGRR